MAGIGIFCQLPVGAMFGEGLFQISLDHTVAAAWPIVDVVVVITVQHQHTGVKGCLNLINVGVQRAVERHDAHYFRQVQIEGLRCALRSFAR